MPKFTVTCRQMVEQLCEIEVYAKDRGEAEELAMEDSRFPKSDDERWLTESRNDERSGMATPDLDPIYRRAEEYACSFASFQKLDTSLCVPKWDMLERIPFRVEGTPEEQNWRYLLSENTVHPKGWALRRILYTADSNGDRWVRPTLYNTSHKCWEPTESETKAFPFWSNYPDIGGPKFMEFKGPPDEEQEAENA